MGNRSTKVHHHVPHKLASPTDRATLLTAEQSTIVDELKTLDFDIDSVVLEGGGAKAAGQIGSLQVLKDLGILQNVTRYAGTSAGALIAAMMALDHEPADVRRVHEHMKKKWFLDAEGAHCAFIPNLFAKFGWNPGARVLEVMHEVIKRKTGKPDITFMEVYQRYRKELCVVAVNLSTMSVEYYHPKISPNMSIVTALRSSISIPILLQPVQSEGSLLVDGGVLCNFPLHAFDGWGLSMKSDDTFFNKFETEGDPFAGYSNKTIGIAVRNATDRIFKKHYSLQEKHLVGWETPVYPNTKLAKERAKTLVKQKDHLYKQKQLLAAGKEFATIARSANWSEEGVVKIGDLKQVFTESPLADQDAALLFGSGTTMMGLIDELQEGNKLQIPGEVTFDELVSHLRSKGVAFRSFMAGSMMANISSFSDVVRVMISAMTGFSRMYFQKEGDEKRTITVNAGYINTTDFEMENADREFLIHQGVNATLRFLKEKALREKTKTSTKPNGVNNNVNSEVTEVTEIQTIKL